MALRSLFHQNSTYAASDLRALIDALGPQVIDANGCVAKGLTVTYASSKLTVAAGIGFATATASTTGHNFAVINTAAVDATNYAGGGTTWSPEGTGTTRTDIVYLKVDDKAIDGAGADATTAYFRLNSTTLPSASCILLARVESANGAVSAIRDMRRAPILAPQLTGNMPLVIAARTSDWSPNSANWTAIPFEADDVIDYRTFAVNLTDNWDMHRIGNTPLTAPYTGWYDIGFRVGWNGSQSGTTQGVGFSVNGGTVEVMAQGIATSDTLALIQNGNKPIHLDVGDSIQLMARTENSTGEIGNAEFWARLISHD
jgi:hypothetical protein